MSVRTFIKGVGASLADSARAFHEAERAQMGLGNIFGGGGVDQVLGQSSESAGRKSFSRDFNIDNFDSFGGSVTSGKYVEIARFRVPADTEYRWGYGAAANPTNQGYIYVDLQDGTDQVDGTIRFKIESATGRQSEVIADKDTQKLDASKTDRDQQIPLPEQSGVTATQDAFLVVEVNANSDTNVQSGSSEVILPVTEFDLS